MNQSRRSDLNRCALDYESSALPAELRRQVKTVTIEGAKCSESVPRSARADLTVLQDNDLRLFTARSVTDDRLARLPDDRSGKLALPLASRWQNGAESGTADSVFQPRSVPKAFLLENREGWSWNTDLIPLARSRPAGRLESRGRR